MNAVAWIFARGGSKGLPGKNIRPFAGKPLISWSIEHALAVNRIRRVLVSTDSEEIAAVARDSGAEVPFMRPSELARDDSSEWAAWRHALNYLQQTDGVLPDAMVSVPTTAPLRMPVDIENALDEYEKGDADVVISITDAHRNPYFNMVELGANGEASVVNSAKNQPGRRQDAPQVYDMTTVVYVARPAFVLSHNGTFEGRVRAVHVPRERAIDIDTMLDFQIAECLWKLTRESHDRDQ